MTETRRFGLVDGLLLLVVLAWAVGTRAAYLRYCADSANSAGALRVQDPAPLLTELPADTAMRGQKPPSELDALVHNLTEHRWFGSLAPFAATEETTAHTSPGYSWLLAPLARSGTDPATFDRLVRWIQCGLGALTAVLYFLFARWAFHNQLVALLAGLFCAIHPFWIVNTAQLDDGVLASFLLGVVVYLGARAGQTAGAFTSLLFGLALAGLALVRAPLLPFAGVALLAFLWHSRTAIHGWRSAVLAFLGFAIGLTPWTIRNVRTFHDAFPIVNSAYVHLWMGHNAKATGGPQSEETMLAALAEAREADARALLDDLGKLSQRERSNELGREVVKEIARDPGLMWQRRIWAGLYFFFGEDWFKQRALAQEVSTPADSLPPWLVLWYPGILAGALFGMLLFGALGWRWTYAWRVEAMPSSLAVLFVPLPYLLSHADSLSGPRLPLDGILLTYAAFAVVALLPWVGGNLWEGPYVEGARKL